MKLILFPLVFLVVFAVLGQLGLGTFETEIDSDIAVVGDWYDQLGHLVCYQNLTAAGEAGTFRTVTTIGGVTEHQWVNETDEYPIGQYNGEGALGEASFEFDAFGSVALIALVTFLIAIGTIAGISIFGSGLGDTSISLLVKGTAFLSIWGIFSVMAFGMITAVPLIGVLFYFFLTVLYCVGVVNQVGSPESV